MALISLAAVAVVAFSVSAVTPAQARSGLTGRPTTLFMMKVGSQFNDNTRGETRIQYSCALGGYCHKPAETYSVHAEPGTFWHAISICDHLEGTGISCVGDPTYSDD
jgi:hypothetical protein